MYSQLTAAESESFLAIGPSLGTLRLALLPRADGGVDSFQDIFVGDFSDPGLDEAPFYENFSQIEYWP
jgi:hypothetical protein